MAKFPARIGTPVVVCEPTIGVSGEETVDLFNREGQVTANHMFPPRIQARLDDNVGTFWFPPNALKEKDR